MPDHAKDADGDAALFFWRCSASTREQKEPLKPATGIPLRNNWTVWAPKPEGMQAD
jgi:hypothetical protein